MDLPPDLPDPGRLTVAERVVVALDALLAVAMLGVAALLVVLGLLANGDPNAPHGGAFEILGAVLLGPPGLLFGLAALAVARRWQARWALQALPVLALVWMAAFGLG